ncbi:hypothetical protein KC19_5G080400 [Ceratodon purpureus]|uniref:Uncharacterized protein n=1 Tax=Ceratodon purpureus TaxID=3225 RepID=A0A8T0HZ60_CERPU|nr:hypothetical protein KC19_5G080400 [Ceratodon purpureus]
MNLLVDLEHPNMSRPQIFPPTNMGAGECCIYEAHRLRRRLIQSSDCNNSFLHSATSSTLQRVDRSISAEFCAWAGLELRPTEGLQNKPSLVRIGLSCVENGAVIEEFYLQGESA